MMQFIRKWGRLLIVVLFFSVLVGIVLFLSDILFPFITACFLAYILFPLIERISQWRIKGRPIPRGVAVIFVYIIILGALIGGGSYLIPNLSNEITQMIKEMPQAINQASNTWLPKVNAQLNQWIDLFPQSSPEEEHNSSTALETVIVPDENSLEKESLKAAFENYTYEIRPLDSGRMEIVPHKKITNSNDQIQKTNHLDIRKHLSNVLQDTAKSIQDNTINFLNFGRQIIAQIAGSIFKLFLILMISAFILVDVNRVLRFGESLLTTKYHHGYKKFLTKLDQGLIKGIVNQSLHTVSHNR